MSQLGAQGESPLLDIVGPHYVWPYVDETLDRALSTQLRRSLSDRDAQGVIGEYERAFADFAQAKHAISFSSGTSALHAMCRAAGLGPGDAVIAPAYTFFATATPFAYEGVRVAFADCDATGNVTAGTLAAALDDDVRAVIVTHMWGRACAMAPIVRFCKQHDLLLFEDCSHAHFASSDHQRVGTFGDMAAFSTNQKAITTGEGGVLTTERDDFKDLALLHGHYNKRCYQEIDPAAEYYSFAFTGMGLKSRMTTLGAAIGLHQLAAAPQIEARRRAIHDRYRDGLADNPVVSVADDGVNGLYVLGLVFHADACSVSRDEFVDRCVAEGAVALDVPGSTRDISKEPLFARHDRHASWKPSAPSDEEFPGVAQFCDAFFKGPIWGYPGDERLVGGYLSVLQKVSADTCS